MTMPMPLAGNDEEKRRRAKAEAQRRIDAGEFTTQEQVDSFMASQGITPKAGPAEDSGALSAGDTWKGRARALGQGLTFEWGDELEAGVRTGAGMFGDYKQTRDQIRGEQSRWAQENPVENIALTMGGAVLPAAAAMIGTGGAAGPAVLPSLGARVARGAIAGVGSGAVAGAGVAEEMGDIPKAAGIGAAAGGVLGGAFPLAGAGARAVGNKFLDVVESPIRALAESAPPPGAAPVGPTRAAAEALRTAPERAARRVLPALESRSRSRAESKLVQALADDGLSPEQAAQRLQQMQGRGLPATVADVGQENMLELANTPYLIPGPGRREVGQFFSERAQGTSGRLADAVEKTSTARMGNVNQMVREIATARQAPAKRLYEAAYQHGPVQLDDNASNLLLTEDLRKAWFEGARRARLDAFTDADKTPLPQLFQIATDEAGDKTIALVREPTVRDIDVVKRGLDAMIGKAMKQEDGDMVRILGNVKSTLLEQVDAQAPTYREARQFWGGQQGLMDALEMGKRFLRGGSDDFTDRIGSLTPDELEMYRIGAANSIAESLRRREGRAVALNILTDPTAQQRLQQIYPDEASFNLLKQAIEDETKMVAPFARMSRQSQTAQNLTNLLDFAADFRPGDMTPGDPTSLALRALRGLTDAGQRRSRESSAFQLAQALTQQGPEAVSYLQGLQSQANARALRAAAGARAGGRTSGVIGGQLNRRNP
jgi:hypothetical protein